jgi:serine/threonine protein kinase
MMKKQYLYGGKYSKIKKIGEGSFGCVYLVKNEEDGKFYAMKKFYLDNVNWFLIKAQK